MRAALPKDEARVLQLARQHPVVGALLEMHWRLQMENPRLPHLFYVMDGAVLKLSGRRAALCGVPENQEELAAFLALQQVEELVSVDVCLPGWRLVAKDMVMRRAALPVAMPELPRGFDEAPDVKDVLAVLESETGPMRPDGAREGFLVDFMVRRNHGGAVVVGVWENETLASTAGAYAITQTEAYVACVETRKAFRGKGYAAALMGYLCAQFGARPMTLLCEDALVDFYRPFGFLPTGMRGCVMNPPSE